MVDTTQRYHQPAKRWHKTRCPSCKGTGKMLVVNQAVYPPEKYYVKCPVCKGKGEKISEN